MNCVICLEEMNESTKLWCGHEYHTECILDVFRHGEMKCCLCRSEPSIEWRFSPEGMDFTNKLDMNCTPEIMLQIEMIQYCYDEFTPAWCSLERIAIGDLLDGSICVALPEMIRKLYGTDDGTVEAFEKQIVEDLKDLSIC